MDKLSVLEGMAKKRNSKDAADGSFNYRRLGYILFERYVKERSVGNRREQIQYTLHPPIFFTRGYLKGMNRGGYQQGFLLINNIDKKSNNCICAMRID